MLSQNTRKLRKTLITRKNLAWLAAAGLALAIAGCDAGPILVVDQDPLTHRLRPLKDSYYEYEPLDFVLVTVNDTPRTRNLGLQDRGAYLVLHEVADNDEAAWRQVPLEQDVVGQQVLPGETVLLRLGDLTGGARLTTPGTWVACYRYFQETGARRKFLFTTGDVRLQCVPQPLVLPENTPADVAQAIKALAVAPAHDYLSQFPSWTKVNYSEPMRRLREMGDRAAPALLANLGHYRIRPAVIQVLADMKCRAAAPQLIALLHMDDSVQDHLILTALATLTGLPKGLDYYSHWDQIETKEEALAAYRAWYYQNK
jgi:hypothetical protein